MSLAGDQQDCSCTVAASVRLEESWEKALRERGLRERESERECVLLLQQCLQLQVYMTVDDVGISSTVKLAAEAIRHTCKEGCRHGRSSKLPVKFMHPSISALVLGHD